MASSRPRACESESVTVGGAATAAATTKVPRRTAAITTLTLTSKGDPGVSFGTWPRVAGVTPGSLAHAAGVRAGHVCHTVGDDAAAAYGDARQGLRGRDRPLTLTFVAAEGSSGAVVPEPEPEAMCAAAGEERHAVEAYKCDIDHPQLVCITEGGDDAVPKDKGTSIWSAREVCCSRLPSEPTSLRLAILSRSHGQLQTKSCLRSSLLLSVRLSHRCSDSPRVCGRRSSPPRSPVVPSTGPPD